MTIAGDRDAFAAPGGGEALMDIRQTLRWAWRVLWRGKFMVLSCWLVAIVPTILYLQQAPVLYTARAELTIEAAEATDAFATRGDLRPRLTENIVMTEVGVMTSAMLARRVIDRLQLQNDPEFNPRLREPDRLAALLRWLNPLTWVASLAKPSDRNPGSALSEQARRDMEEAQIVRAFLGRLDAEMQRRSFIIRVSFTSESREKAAKIVNTVTELYVLDRLEASFEDARRVTGWLAERINALQRDVQVAESAVEDFRALHGLRRKGDRQSTVTDQQLSELNSRLVVARTDLAQKQARLDQVRSLIRTSGNIESSYDVLQSQLIQRLREQETTLVREMSEAVNIYGERHPRMVAYRADLAQLREKLDAEMQRISQAIANEVEVATAGVRTLERELAALQGQVNVAGEAEVNLRELERQAEATRGLYEAFLQRFKREAETQEGVQRANARIITPAQIPGAASFPRPVRTISLVSILALGLGIVLIFLIDRLDNAVRSSDEAEDITGVPTLAIVPLHRGGKDRMIDELANNPRSGIADALRNLRVTLDLNVHDDLRDPGPARIVALTSSIPKEGKTFVALCFAVMTARSGQRVLLVDGDIHRPRLHTMVGIDNERGLLQLMDGSATLDDVVVRSIAPGLDFVPAGSSPNIADQVREAEAAPLFRDLASRYDRVILDLPPVLAVADARVLASLADRVIYLVRWNSTARDAVRNGIKLLREAKVNLHGVVLSQVNQRKHARYAYGDYGTYYGRYREYYTE